MENLIRAVDQLIDTSIHRLSTSESVMVYGYRLDLLALFDRVRLTQKLKNDSIEFCNSRGIQALEDVYTGGLLITIDLRTCMLNYQQAQDFNTALTYARQFHGDDV